ncbi:MAG: hypothetical protein AB1631_12670 [Acidobacteriota bacterium]
MSLRAFDRYRLRLLIALAFTVCALSGCKGVLLDDRFHDRSLRNWTVIDDPDTIEGPSRWAVESDGWLHQRSNIWGRRGDFLGRWYGTFLVAGDTRWSDYLLMAKARPDDGDGFGIVFRFQDAEHFYRLLFINDSLNGGPLTRLDRRNGADYTQLWSAERGYKVGSEMLIEVEVEGETIRATVDGRALFEIKDASISRGKVGLFCYAQNGQAFDEVKVIER